MAHPPGECAGVERTLDLGTQFCERCGRDRDSFASARNTYRDCPSCEAACCADCWNLVDGACLACAPFRLTDATTRPRIVIAAERAPATARVDPYADLRSDPGTPPAPDGWGAGRVTARQRPRDRAPAGLARSSTTRDLEPAVRTGSSTASLRRPRRRAGRVGLAASAAWVVVGALALVALGASPAREVPVPLEAVPSVAPSVVPSQATTPAPARPTATPRATRAPRATPQPHPPNPGVTKPRVTPRPTPRPVRPVVVAPPPAPTPAPTATAASTPETSDP